MSLCIQCRCTFCCDGTLYSSAPLKEEDIPLLASRFDITHEARNNEIGKAVASFKQPCKFCTNNGCSIHHEKPAICRDYQCKLLANHALGRVSTEEARTVIDHVKRLRDRIRPQMEQLAGAGSELSFVELTGLVVDRLEKMDAAERSSGFAEMLLDFAMLRVLLAKNFDSRLMQHTYLADKALQVMDSTSEAPSQP